MSDYIIEIKETCTIKDVLRLMEVCEDELESIGSLIESPDPEIQQLAYQLVSTALHE